MKNLILVFSVFLGFAFGTSAQEMNKKVFDEKSQTDILVGNCDRDGLMSCEFGNSYNEEYPTYNPNGDIIHALKERIQGVSCTLVLGTWCGDSKEQVPRFLKIVDMTDNPFDELKIICVDRNKEAPDMKVKEQYLIDKVPTFIFYRGDTEIGRIIETPKESLEKDLLDIVRSK
jgi:thiol-disulfide isomerase/thioredoxin